MPIYVTRALPDDLMKRLEASGEELRLWRGEGPVPRERLVDEVADVDGLLTMLTDTIDVGVLDRGRGLRVVSQMAVGVDNIDVAACHARGIRVGHTPDVLTGTVADHAFALLLAAARRIPEGQAEVRAGEWGEWDPWHDLGVDVHGTTLGIVGMGRVGNEIARRSTGFEMQVLYASRRVTGEIGARVPLEELLERSDHVVVAVPLTEQTRGLFDAARFERMKPTAVFVNISRGPVVDQAALETALRDGVIFAAALDVTDPEPLPPGHPLANMANCLVVPHVASASFRTRRAMAARAVDNLLAGLAGSEMPSELA